MTAEWLDCLDRAASELAEAVELCSRQEHLTDVGEFAAKQLADLNRLRTAITDGEV